jgi:hypothetical protein
MTTQAFTQFTPSSKRYGVTEKKKAELDALAIQILDAQQQVDQYQAIVTAFTQKLTTFQGFLAVDDANRTSSLSNLQMVTALVQSFEDLSNSASIAFNQMVVADSTTKKLASRSKVVLDKLIYTSEFINRFATIVMRKKALNPLISDDLISMVNAAGNDANKAVALTLIAMQSSFTAQATNMESEAAAGLAYVQILDICHLLTGEKNQFNSTETQSTSLANLISEAYKKALEQYNKTFDAVQVITTQLNDSQIALAAATNVLNSLQLGLAAGNAAALAS